MFFFIKKTYLALRLSICMDSLFLTAAAFSQKKKISMKKLHTLSLLLF